jgi:hypothetical protein
MDSGLVLKPAASVAQTGTTRSETTARGAAPTELSAAKTVTAPASTAAALAEDSRGRQLVLDPHSREVMYRVLDERLRRTASRTSEVAAQRLKAYSRPARTRRNDDDARDPDAHADIEV